MNRRRGSWEQGRAASQRRESDPLGAFIRQKRQPLANIGFHPSIVRQPSVNPDGWPVDLDFLRCCCVGYSPIRGCFLLAPSRKSKPLTSRGRRIRGRVLGEDFDKVTDKA